MFGSIWSEFQCLDGYGQYSDVWKGMVSTFKVLNFLDSRNVPSLLPGEM